MGLNYKKRQRLARRAARQELAVRIAGAQQSLLHGDCIEVLRTMEADSVDALVADPPYGIRFMGKSWDHADIQRAVALKHKSERRNPRPPQHGVATDGGARMAGSYDHSAKGHQAFQDWSELWGRQALRVLKPGAHALVFGSPRTFHRMASGLEDAGFEVRDCLMWIFASGFPKARNLKPAYEPVVLLRKPFPGSTARNVAERGTGALNINAARVGERWPANVILDKSVAAELGEKSRWFYCPKPSRGERDAGLEHLPARAHGMSGGAQSALRKGNGYHAAQSIGLNRISQRRNIHPTTKPIALMRWLCKLITPPGGLILDPFAGSGSTGCAAVLEGFGFVGIERERDYIEIARARLAHWTA